MQADESGWGGEEAGGSHVGGSAARPAGEEGEGEEGRKEGKEQDRFNHQPPVQGKQRATFEGVCFAY